MRPIERLIYLWKRRDDKEAKISLMFYVCLYIILLTDLVFGYFFYFESKTMFIVNIVCILINLFIYHLYENNKRALGVYILITELHVFMIFATLIMGWNYGFQQYLYGMLCIFFLPFYIPDDPKHKGLHVGIVSIIFVLTYFVLDYICNQTSLAPGIENPIFNVSKIHTINSFVSIAAVSSFCILSSMINQETTRKLKRKADFDELTQVYNRYGLNQILDNMRQDNKKFYLAIADIDFFKNVNDTYGHDVGDMVLKDVASTFVSYINRKIFIGRWGGEEFFIIGDHSIGHGDFKKLLDEIRETYENKTIKANKKEVNITISFGIGRSDSKKTIEEAIKEADNNLYKAKESGRNKIVG